METSFSKEWKSFSLIAFKNTNNIHVEITGMYFTHWFIFHSRDPEHEWKSWIEERLCLIKWRAQRDDRNTEICFYICTSSPISKVIT